MSRYPNTYVINMIKTAAEDERRYAAQYGYAAENTENNAEKTMLRNISLDCERHCKMLKDIYKKLEGKEYTDECADENTFDKNMNYAECALNLIDSTEQYRTIMYALADTALRDYMHGIITDCQNNAVRLALIAER